ncbi:MAG: hypothetical protein U1D30_11005 [Planctomycetota bacterium]
MLELRFRDGRIMALSYVGLDKVDFDPSGEIQLYFSPKKVTITGRNLNAEVRPNVRSLSGACPPSYSLDSRVRRASSDRRDAGGRCYRFHRGEINVTSLADKSM